MFKLFNSTGGLGTVASIAPFPFSDTSEGPKSLKAITFDQIWSP